MKVAISVPDTVFEAGENLAKQLRLSRSQLYSDALALYLSARGAEAVKERLNAVYGSTSSAVENEFLAAQNEVLSREPW